MLQLKVNACTDGLTFREIAAGHWLDGDFQLFPSEGVSEGVPNEVLDDLNRYFREINPSWGPPWKSKIGRTTYEVTFTNQHV
jgi:hypothetical protein